MLVYLIGYMGCGKSTLGKKLAAKLGYKFVDLDDYIEQKQQCSITEIFALEGEEGFRKIEQACIKESMNWSSTIVATGGGAPCFFNNMSLMNSAGETVYIELNAEALHSRLISAQSARPLIKDKSSEELLQFIQENLEKRNPFYRKAKHIMPGIDITPEKVIENLGL